MTGDRTLHDDDTSTDNNSDSSVAVKSAVMVHETKWFKTDGLVHLNEQDLTNREWSICLPTGLSFLVLQTEK